ncbi:hypothetical protein BASA81_000742 [Batrachochytrium salamandrivorans]|nr:hypothetical protein BASA81_000742 [Batrachochytrium salamandrivorans]
MSRRGKEDEEEEEYQSSKFGYDSESDGGEDGGSGKRGKKKSKGGFHAMKLGDNTMQGIKFLGFKQPTPIQRKAIPPALLGRDLVAMARTGSGKTASFLIPAVEILSRSATAAFRCIILSPTRELAIQTYTIAKTLARKTGLKLCLLHGGDTKVAQFDALSANPDMLICTPGRLADLLNETQDFSLSHLQLLIIDEADRLFEMNFQSQLQEIFERMPKEKQTLLFSATLPKELAEFARVKLNSDTVELIRLDTDMRISDTLKLTFFKIRNLDERLSALLHVLRTVVDCQKESSIIFCATKQQVEYLVYLLRQMENLTGMSHYEHVGIGMAHGSMDQEARGEALSMFRSGKLRILITTDLAARGLDIPLVNNVINFDFPDKSKLFVHRVGRAARQGRAGHAVSFVAVEEMSFFVDVCLYLGGGDESRIGTLPQPVLDEGVEWEAVQRKDNAELEQMYKSSVNAHKMYIKTRVEPSKRSMKRAKELVIGMHPMFGSFNGASVEENNAAQLQGSVSREDLAKFRPKKSTFETELSKNGTNNNAAVKALEFARSVNMRKALNHELVLENNNGETKVRVSAAQKRKQKQRQMDKDAQPVVVAPAPGAPTGQYRDERFFLSNESSQGTSRSGALDNDFESQLRVHHLSEAVLDLNPDDTEGLAKKSRSFQWDKRKKKYIQSTVKDHVAAKRLKSDVETEAFGSGMKKGEAYEKWAKKTRKRIGGSEPTGDITDVAQLALLRRQAKRANTPEYAPGRRLRDEVKNEDQLIKEHKQKAKKTAKLKAKAAKTKAPRVKAGEDAKVNRIGRTKPKPKQWSRSYVK